MEYVYFLLLTCHVCMEYVYFLLLTYQVCVEYVYFLLLTYQVCIEYVYFLLLTYQVCNKLRPGCPDLFDSMKYVYFLFICYFIADQPQSQEQATNSSTISVNQAKSCLYKGLTTCDTLK